MTTKEVPVPTRHFVQIYLLLMIAFISSCSDSNTPAIKDIAIYPGAIEMESMQQHLPGGLMGGQIIQYTSDDSFEEILDFYQQGLEKHQPESIEQNSESGHQVALSIQRNQSILTVVIQEFQSEQQVTITFMEVGF